MNLNSRLPSALIAVMAVTSLVLGIMEAAATQSGRAIVGVGGAIILIAYSAFLGWIARGLWRLAPRAHAPAIAVGILHLPIAWSFRGGGTTWIAVAMAASSLAILVCLLMPRSMRDFGRVPANEAEKDLPETAEES